jgi:hypothetical protein
MKTGGCQCGAARYECDAESHALLVCRCLEWCHQSASAFGMSFPVAASTIRVTRGTSNSGRGSPTAAGASALPSVAIAARACGTTRATASSSRPALDEFVDLSHAIDIWTSCKLPAC